MDFRDVAADFTADFTADFANGDDGDDFFDGIGL